MPARNTRPRDQTAAIPPVVPSAMQPGNTSDRCLRVGRLLWCRPLVWVNLHRFGTRLVSWTRPRRRLGRRALVWLHGNGLGSHLASSNDERTFPLYPKSGCLHVTDLSRASRTVGPGTSYGDRIDRAPAPRRSETAGAVFTGGAALRPTREGSAHPARTPQSAIMGRCGDGAVSSRETQTIGATRRRGTGIPCDTLGT